MPLGIGGIVMEQYNLMEREEREVYNWYQMHSEANDLTSAVLIKQILSKGSKWKYKLVKEFAAAALKPFLTS